MVPGDERKTNNAPAFKGEVPWTMKIVVKNDLTTTNVAGMESNTEKDEHICGGLYAGDSGEELGQGEA